MGNMDNRYFNRIYFVKQKDKHELVLIRKNRKQKQTRTKTQIQKSNKKGKEIKNNTHIFLSLTKNLFSNYSKQVIFWPKRKYPRLKFPYAFCVTIE